MKIIMLVFALFLTTQTNAEAGVLLEPYVGYQALLTDLTLGEAVGPLAGQSIKVDGTGTGFGLRLGYSFAMAFVAVDYSTATLQAKIKEQPDGAGLTGESQTHTSLGVTAGADFKMVRPYLGYIFDDQVKGDSTTYSGTGFKVGIGFSFIPKLAINAEYQTLTYSKAKSSDGTETTFSSSGVFSSVKSSGFFVSVSVPLEF